MLRHMYIRVESLLFGYGSRGKEKGAAVLRFRKIQTALDPQGNGGKSGKLRQTQRGRLRQIRLAQIDWAMQSIASKRGGLRPSKHLARTATAVSETAAKNQGFAGRTATHRKAQGGNATASVGSALNLIDTGRYIDWPRRLILYIGYIGFVVGFPWNCLAPATVM